MRDVRHRIAEMIWAMLEKRDKDRFYSGFEQPFITFDDLDLYENQVYITSNGKTFRITVTEERQRVSKSA